MNSDSYVDSDGSVLTIRRGPYIRSGMRGTLRAVEYFNVREQRHRIDGPAVEVWDATGQLRGVEWRQNDQLHRAGGPAFGEWHESGHLKQKDWYVGGHLHRLDGPASERWGEGSLRSYFDWWYRGAIVPLSKTLEVAVALWSPPEVLMEIALSDHAAAPFAAANPGCPQQGQLMWALKTVGS